MATAAQSPSPPPRPREGFFTFLKRGVLIPTRNRGLFLPLAALYATRSTAFLLVRTLTCWSFAATVDGDASVRFFTQLGRFLADCPWLLPAGAVYLAAHVALGLAIEVAVACAAVASCSGERHTLHSLLMGKVKGNLRGPMVTIVSGDIRGWAYYLGAAAASTVLAAFLSALSVGAGLLALILMFLGLFFFVMYFPVVCAVAVVASVAEPGRRGGGALERARRLMRGKKGQAVLYTAVAWALEQAVWKTHALAMASMPQSVAAAMVRPDAVVVYLFLGVLKVFCTATVTAYYFECRATEEEKAGHRE
ncbi:hypothetical protein ACP70R_030818 [Stipagrostis hirtigluma subsp. patula]